MDNKTRPLRGLFVGLGRAGRGTLERFLAQPATQVAGVVDPSPTCLEGLALPADAKRYDDLASALDETNADVAFISSPNAYHCEQFLACAQYGLDIWIEKPVALTVADALVMQAAAERAGIQVITPYGAESAWYLRHAIQVARSGKLGPVMQVLAVKMGGAGLFADAGNTHPALRAPEIWGGWVHHHLCHSVDWAMQVAGRVVSAHCLADSTIPDARWGQEETMTATLRFEGQGAAALVESQLQVKHHRYAVLGQRGGLFIEQHPRARGEDVAVRLQTAVGIESETQTYTALQYAEMAQQQGPLMQRWLKMVREGSPAPAPMQRSIDVLRVCEALVQSLRTGQVTAVAQEATAAAR